MTPAPQKHSIDALASSFNWSGVSSFIDLNGTGDISPGETALSVISQYENIISAAVLEPSKTLQKAVTFAPQLRKQFGERNFNKLVYVPGDAHSTKVPAGYDVYLIRNMKPWTEEYWTKILKNVKLALSNETKSLLIVTTSSIHDIKSVLEKNGLSIWAMKESTEDVFIIEAKIKM